MIVVDTSALAAITLDESSAAICSARINQEQRILISAGTLTEAYIVASRRNIVAEMHRLINGIGPDVVAVTAETARQIEAIYRRWGKHFHPASLNFGDCFAYALAKEYDCPLLYVGNDFAQTDITPAI